MGIQNGRTKSTENPSTRPIVDLRSSKAADITLNSIIVDSNTGSHKVQMTFNSTIAD